MAGLIKREDIDEVRNRVRIDEVVGEFVTLRTAGIGSMKGLCPFHDEKTPSFHVRPQVGMYHCFGCGESGDAFSFLQKVEQLSFVEAVEALASKAGIHLSYEDGQGPDKEQASRRQRLLEMHEVAQRLYSTALGDDSAQVAREFLNQRGFPQQAITDFGLGFAPQSWDSLTKALHKAGFNDEEILAAGLASEGRRGIYDRFRGRVVWPIKDMTSRTIGFGARRLFDDDQGPKYLNTPETPLYHKNQVLYGLDRAKKNIAKTKRVVIVEGYTDVMAAHLAGVTQAVATCGTAFGAEHVKVVRRLLGDDPSAEVIFTFDGDAAGQKAALKAFEFESEFSAQTFVAIEADGLDPCDLRLQKGDGALKELVDKRKPLFEFVITTSISRFDLDAVEGRIAALRSAAEVLVGIRDRNSLSHYYRFVAGRIGVDMTEVEDAVRRARQRPQKSQGSAQERPARQQEPPGAPRRPAVSDRNADGVGSGADATRGGPTGATGRQPNGSGTDEAEIEYVYDERPDVSNLSAPISPARLKVEKGALMVALQHPEFVNAKLFDSLSAKAFEHPGYRRIQASIQAAGGLKSAGTNTSRWAESVLDVAAEDLKPYVAQLLVTPLPVAEGVSAVGFSQGVVARLFDFDLERIAKELHSRLQRHDTGDIDGQTALLGQLQVLEQHRARLKALM